MGFKTVGTENPWEGACEVARGGEKGGRVLDGGGKYEGGGKNHPGQVFH